MRISKNTFRLLPLLLFYFLIQLSACTDREATELLGSSPNVQMGLPDENEEFAPCGCILSPLAFNTNLEVGPIETEIELSSFTATVSGMPDCDISGCNENKGCYVSGHSYRLIINNAGQYPLSYNDFSSILVTDLEGGPIEYSITETVIRANHPFSATFSWDTASSLNESFEAIQLLPGGICIIDIWTNPNDPGNGSTLNNDSLFR